MPLSAAPRTLNRSVPGTALYLLPAASAAFASTLSIPNSTSLPVRESRSSGAGSAFIFPWFVSIPAQPLKPAPRMSRTSMYSACRPFSCTVARPDCNRKVVLLLANRVKTPPISTSDSNIATISSIRVRPEQRRRWLLILRECRFISMSPRQPSAGFRCRDCPTSGPRWSPCCLRRS